MPDEQPLNEAERLGPAPPVPESGPRRLVGLAAIDLGPLRRHREYRLLWFGLAVSFFGSELAYVAVPYQVYKLTGSTAVVGLLALAKGKELRDKRSDIAKREADRQIERALKSHHR